MIQFSEIHLILGENIVHNLDKELVLERKDLKSNNQKLDYSFTFLSFPEQNYKRDHSKPSK